MSGFRWTRLSALAVLLMVMVFAAALPPAGARAGELAEGVVPQSQCSGNYYTVRPGDYWSTAAGATGVDVVALQVANPQAVRRSGWLFVGEVLCVPTTVQSTATQTPGGYWYHVKTGDTWNVVSRHTGVPVRELWRANSKLLDKNLWLYVGQRVWVPDAAPAAATATPPAIATATQMVSDSAGPGAATQTPVVVVITATVVVTVEVPVTVTPPALPPTEEPATAAPSPEPTREATVPPPLSPTFTPMPAPTQTPEALVTPAPARSEVSGTPLPAGACPANIDGYAITILERLNASTPGDEGIAEWLNACGVVTEDYGGVFPLRLVPGGDDAIVVILHELPDEIRNTQGALLVYASGQNGMMQMYRADGSWLELIKAGDTNEDGAPDLVWVDRSCGAHTCYATLHVDTWDVNQELFVDWLEGEPEMAEPNIAVKAAVSEGQGLEIVMNGGIIASAGAGAVQRGRTEIYISRLGEPYALFTQVYDPSACAYHAVLDANLVFDRWNINGFEPAETAYRGVIDNAQLRACGTLTDEVTVLKDFARFRLIVSHVAAGNAASASPLLNQIKTRAIRGAADTFLRSYRSTSSIIQACRETTRYATRTTDSWKYLEDWGYANPTFTAQDLCPIR